MQACWWTMLLLVAFGAHASLHVCMGSCCGAVTDTARAASDDADGCCCRRECHRRDGKPDGDRGSCAVATACDSCCVDLGLELAPAPLPRPVGVGAPPDLSVGTATALPTASAPLPLCATEPGTPATGPPRCDRRTLLLSSTVLRL